MKHYDKVPRKVKSKGGKSKWIFVNRCYCPRCRSVKRDLPDKLVKFKQYEKDIIDGVREGLITDDTLGYEDFPCEMTKKRWSQQKEGLI